MSTARKAVETNANNRPPAIQRLLFVADAAVAELEDLPPAVRATIAGAGAVYVVTPTLPGRLSWLDDEFNDARHAADARLDTVMGHMRSLGAHVSGAASRTSVLFAVADAVKRFKPDHILLALRDSQHANWQEHGLLAEIEQRFDALVTSYAVDIDGHTPPADGPVFLCYDGSADARYAIGRAGRLFAGRRAVVMTVWRPAAGLGTLAWSGALASMTSFFELDRAAADEGDRVAKEGARIARAAGLEAESLAVEAAGPIWRTIVETADNHNAGAIVMGSRGLTGVRSMLLGSVSSAIVHHADRPTLVIRQSVDSA